jgi:hypothetical protein
MERFIGEKNEQGSLKSKINSNIAISFNI